MFCFDSDNGGGLSTAICHNSQGNQYFRYDVETKQIFHGSRDRNECIDMNPSESHENSVIFSQCDESSETQKWNWGFLNETALNNWIEYGSQIIDKNEILMLKQKNNE